MPKHRNVITESIARFGLQPFAAKFGVSYQAIKKWEKANHGQGRVPAERVRAFAEITGLADYIIRPDLYRKP